jgi:hypothetical protein
MPETSIVKCTAINCISAKECQRKRDIDHDDVNEAYYNYSLDCNQLTGYQDYIKD